MKKILITFFICLLPISLVGCEDEGVTTPVETGDFESLQKVLDLYQGDNANYEETFVFELYTETTVNGETYEAYYKNVQIAKVDGNITHLISLEYEGELNDSDEIIYTEVENEEFYKIKDGNNLTIYTKTSDGWDETTDVVSNVRIFTTDDFKYYNNKFSLKSNNIYSITTIVLGDDISSAVITINEVGTTTITNFGKTEINLPNFE